MVTATRQNMFLAEPVQWAREYLLDILETLDASADDEHCLALLSLEREELLQIWHSVSADGRDSGPVFYCFGRNAPRLFVIHQLLAAMPAAARSRLQSNAASLGKTCRRFLELFFFLSAASGPLTEKAPEPAVIKRALRLGCRLLPGPAASGQRLSLYCLDYRLPSPACFLPFSHTLVYGASVMSREEQLYRLLRHFACVRQITKTTRVLPDKILYMSSGAASP